MEPLTKKRQPKKQGVTVGVTDPSIDASVVETSPTRDAATYAFVASVDVAATCDSPVHLQEHALVNETPSTRKDVIIRAGSMSAPLSSQSRPDNSPCSPEESHSRQLEDILTHTMLRYESAVVDGGDDCCGEVEVGGKCSPKEDEWAEFNFEDVGNEEDAVIVSKHHWRSIRRDSRDLPFGDMGAAETGTAPTRGDTALTESQSQMGSRLPSIGCVVNIFELIQQREEMDSAGKKDAVQKLDELITATAEENFDILMSKPSQPSDAHRGGGFDINFVLLQALLTPSNPNPAEASSLWSIDVKKSTITGLGSTRVKFEVIKVSICS